jgi:diguanylate cyclase (GGDEF)-like protein
MDIDHFKRFNDTFGHDAGDAMLRQVGQVVLSCVRAEDIACRYGGEEIAIIIPDAPMETAVERATAIKDKVKLLNLTLQGQALGAVTVSLGVSAFPNHGVEWKTLLHAADLALYQAKRDGRDRVVVAETIPERESTPESVG